MQSIKSEYDTRMLLYVPIRAKLLRIVQPTAVTGPSFDASLLPWFENVDRNAETAFLGDEICGRPFQNKHLVLLPGIHLHWQIPRKLTRPRVDGSYVPLPNRWLVSRTAGSARESWVVQSDYCHPKDAPEPPPHSFTVWPLVGDHQSPPHTPPFVRVGRTTTLEEFNAGVPQPIPSLPRFDLMAGGNPAFASFYPDCQGIFTFFDRAGATDAQYSISGWYANHEDDQFRLWEDDGEEKKMPADTRLICFGRIQSTVPIKSGSARLLNPRKRNITRSKVLNTEAFDDLHVLGIGNTATEALSAFIAARLAPETPQTQAATMENHLESILQASSLTARLQDQHAKFVEGRHANGFIASHGGTHWIIKTTTPMGVAAADQPPLPQGGLQVPDDCAALLQRLNLAQHRLDRLRDHRTTLLQRVSADWHKYMLCAYPPPDARDDFPEPDAVLHALQSRPVKQLQQLNGEITEAGQDCAILSVQITALFPPAQDGVKLELKALPGPRYWSPRNPVVICEAPEALHKFLPAADAQSADDPLKVLMDSVPLMEASTKVDQRRREEEHRNNLAGSTGNTGGITGRPPPSTTLPATLQMLTEPSFPASLLEKHPLAFVSSDEGGSEPARPIYCEWAVTLHPGQNRNGDYAPDHLSAAFSPDAGGPESMPRRARKVRPMDGASYTGQGLVSIGAPGVLHGRLHDYLLHTQLPGMDRITEDQLVSNVDSLIAAAPPGSIVSTALRAWKLLAGTRFLSLTFDGFHEALLMRRRMPQLPIADPIGFPEYQKAALSIQKEAGDLASAAPAPLNVFHPLRAGRLELDRLGVTDSFGRAHDVNLAGVKVCPAETLRSPETALPVLPPRFVQAMRSRFRWLSAFGDGGESNSHPDSSPVCGWILPNILDESLEFYDAGGIGIGTLDMGGTWRANPGSEHPIVPRDIANPHLRRVVMHLVGKSRDARFQPEFFSNLTTALENIDPDSFASQPGLALLVGRPVAVVRASVKFELRGDPAEDHSWAMLRDRLDGKQPNRSRGYEHIRIPFRIGEHHILNDGVAGYWVEGPEGGFVDEKFHAPALTAAVEQQRENREFLLSASPSDDPVRLTLLMDPRGSAHLTCGVLPVKEIRLEEHHYSAALQRMEVTFLAAPLLMTGGRTEIPLPGEPGFLWSFVERTPRGWSITPASEITPPELNGAFRAPMSLREGWLRLTPVPPPAPPDTPSASK